MTNQFVRHRALLFTVAYEMLGSAADAEDVVQETWLRWVDVDHSQVRDPRAYLVRIVTRLALNRLRTLARRREDYVGEWLPEPVLTSPDVAEDVVLAESVSMAMLTVLETLGPTERAAFILREVFEMPYGEIAEVIGKTPGATRQLIHRARAHVAARRSKVEVDPAEQRAVVERFLHALDSGDIQSLMDVLAPEVVASADGGGLVAAVRQPVRGAEKVAGLLSRLAQTSQRIDLGIFWVNGAPALRIELEGELVAAVSLTTDGQRITRIFGVLNPFKLSRLGEEKTLSRSA